MLPGNAHHWIGIIGRIAEIIAQVYLVVCIGEVVHPASGVGIHIDYIGVKEVPRTTHRAIDGLPYDTSLIIYIGSVFGNPYLLIGISLHIGVQVTLLGSASIATLGCLGVVVYLVAVVQLLHIQHLFSRNGMHGIEALYGTLLLLIGFLGQCFLPVQMRFHRITLLVFLYLIGFVASIGGVGKAFAQDRVAHIEHKLAILRIGYLGFVHPESFHRDVSHGRFPAPQTVLFLNTHPQMSTLDKGHSVWRRLAEGSASHSSNLSPGGSG